MQLINQTPFAVAAVPLIGPKAAPMLTVIVKATFDFDGRPADQQPIAYGDQVDPVTRALVYESDLAPFKPRADIVLCAAAHAPKGRPADHVRTSVTVGKTGKDLIVFGDRYWNHAGVLRRSYTITRAKAFVSRPIVYQEAFGGQDPGTGHYCAQNLAGKGFFSKKTKEKIAGKPLPAIEDPTDLIKHVGDHPKPAGYGIYNRCWQPRADFAGTFDETWRQNRCPLPPEDFDFAYYNCAHPDLQVKHYLRGDEPVELINLTAQGRAAFNLPGLQPTCLARRSTEQKLEALALTLDTLFIEPDKGRYCLVWRGGLDIQGLSGADIARLIIGHQPITSPREPHP